MNDIHTFAKLEKNRYDVYEKLENLYQQKGH